MGKMLFQLFSVLLYTFGVYSKTSGRELQVITVATEANDAYNRFMKSAEKSGVNTKVLGMGMTWEGGDVANGIGGGHKINLLKEAMKEWKDDKNVVVMFVDSYDLIITGSSDEILEAFDKFDARVVFSAEGFCWPDTSLADKYPEVKPNEKRFLNSGGFIGYAPEIYKLVTQKEVQHGSDDQLYYTNIFLNPELRGELSMKLDTKSEIFQNLNGALDEVKVKFKGSNSYLYNIKTGMLPFVIHGNGPIKTQFNSLTNYLGDSWTPTAGCLSCKEDTMDLSKEKEEDYPEVMIAVHINYPTPFIDDFFERIANLTYPKDKIHMFIQYSTDYNSGNVEKFQKQHGEEYKSVEVKKPKDIESPAMGKNAGIDACMAKNCDYYFALDGEAQLENPRTLIQLIERNRSVVVPLMIRPGKMWSVFWGALNSEGYYKRADDYADIVQGKKIGLWKAPYVHAALLIQGNKLKHIKGGYLEEDMDPDMALCLRMREKNIFMYVDNQDYYGHLVNADNFEPAHYRDDLYEIMENQYTWEKKYIHPDYKKHAAEEFKNLEPCTDVFWLPMATPTFCQHLIDTMENYGKWSGGKNKNENAPGLYDAVPTWDIHTFQVGWEEHWLYILNEYIVPIANKIFIGYYSQGNGASNFVVKYKPGEQDRLRPHQDHSTYTVNLALNRVNTDYEGGGVRFPRYNCNVTDLRQGWLLMHPGRLTHEHEGLQTTNGTRYIMVSFIDP